MTGSAYFEIWKKTLLAEVILLNGECPKLLCGLGIDHRRRKTTSPWKGLGKILHGITVCLVSLQYWALCDSF